VATVRASSPRGFTLIELLVVMSIVALLLTMAMPRYFGSMEKSKDAVLLQNLQTLRTNIDRFYGDKGRYPNDLNELVEARYLRAVPVDPVTESATTWILDPPRDPKMTGVYGVKSGAPGVGANGVPYAQF